MLFKRTIIPALTALMLAPVCALAQKYAYDTVPGDPMHVKMHTLPNGMRVYMSVNTDKPQIQTNIAVRVGSKNDPSETTGLAHYFEHLMFKGTPEFGTSNYEAEKPLLDEIEQLFEVYRQTTDSTERAAIYHRIDSISYEASRYAIPNEYDKLMSAIGSSGSNAYTSYDQTCYVECIPSNRLETWARIQAARFKNPVLRGFHTELETIYEEKNMSLTDDRWKALFSLLQTLYPNHPYGQRDVLGTQQHLKNPSITNIKAYHKQWYVPNNMAIVLSGDFNPDEALDVIYKYFGDMTPNEDLPTLSFEPNPALTSPQKSEVYGPESEAVYLAWRLPGASDRDIETLKVVDYLLCNGNAGMLDLNVNQKQLALETACYYYDLADYTTFFAYGKPKDGQTLDQVRDLILGQLKMLRDGDFDEAMLPAIISNFKLREQKQLESNDERVDAMVASFITGEPWADAVTAIDRQENLTKADIVAFARKYLGPDNYAIAYKRQGEDTTIVKMPKPALTPVMTNRDMASGFLKDVLAETVEPIEPRFVDFERDLTILNPASQTPVLYKQNTTNDLFTLTYVFETGTNADRLLDTASDFLDLLGTPDMTAEQIKARFFELACTYSIVPGDRRSYIVLSGLSENMPEAMKLMEKLIYNAVPDETAWNDYRLRLMAARANAKTEQGANFSALMEYGIYGPEYVALTLTDDELNAIEPVELTNSTYRLLTYPHRIIYYGPMDQKSLLSALKRNHHTPRQFAALPEAKDFPPKETKQTVIYLAPYDSNQIYMYLSSNNGEQFDTAMEPARRLYNGYFDGDMSSIVFQEMRESRSLAYSASAWYSQPSRLDRPYTYNAFIATQNDKMMDAITAFSDIINDMPVSPQAFALTKEGMDASLRTSRTIKDNVAWSYIDAQDHGLDYSLSEKMFEALPAMTLDDVCAFQREHVKGRTYTYIILGRLEDLDMDALQRLGKVVILTPEQTFGY